MHDIGLTHVGLTATNLEASIASVAPLAHLGVGCPDRAEVDRLSDMARPEGRLVEAPVDFGPPIGYRAFIRDPDGHTLEVSFGQEIGLAVEDAP